MDDVRNLSQPDNGTNMSGNERSQHTGEEDMDIDSESEKAPEFNKPLDNQEVKEKEKFTLKCELSKPDMFVKWLKNGEEVKPDDRVVVSMDQYLHQLVVAEATLDDAAKYSCVCGDVSTDCTIKVTELLVEFTKHLQDTVAYDKDKTATLTCELSMPNKPVKWLKNGEPVQANKNLKISVDVQTHQLVFTDVTLKDIGQYSCECGHVSTTATFTVKEEQVKFRKPLKDTEVTEKDKVTLTCELNKNGKKPAWYFDEKVIVPGDRFKVISTGFKHELTIVTSKLIDKGKYTVAFDDAKSTATLIVKAAKDASCRGHSGDEHDNFMEPSQKMQQQLHGQRYVEAIKDMLYRVFENVLMTIEEYEKRTDAQGMPSSEIKLPDQSWKSDGDVRNNVEAQLLVFEAHIDACPSDVTDKENRMLRQLVIQWSAVRQGASRSATDDYIAQLYEILVKGQTHHAIVDRLRQKVTASTIQETLQNIMDAKEKAAQLDKSYEDNPDKKAECPKTRICASEDAAFGARRINDVKTGLENYLYDDLVDLKVPVKMMTFLLK